MTSRANVSLFRTKKLSVMASLVMRISKSPNTNPGSQTQGPANASQSSISVISMHMRNHAQVAFKEMKLNLEFLTGYKISFQTG